MKSTFFAVASLFLFLFSIAFLRAEEPVPVEKLSDFMRVAQKEGRRQPQSFDTAVVKFRNEKGIEVDLVAAVHVGDKEYYDELNELFQGYDALLYELVAEEGVVLDKKTLADRKDKNVLSAFQTGMGQALDLDFQLENIDYTAKNFVHADLSPEEFVRRVSERGDLVQMFYRAIMLGAKKGKEGQDNEMRMQGKLFSTVFASNPSLSLKRFFAREMLRQMDDSMWIIAGDGSAIITDRNKAALQVLRREIKQGRKKLGIFYGGAHLPEFAKSLQKEFKMKPVGLRWVVAWDLTSDRSARNE